MNDLPQSNHETFGGGSGGWGELKSSFSCS